MWILIGVNTFIRPHCVASQREWLTCFLCSKTENNASQTDAFLSTFTSVVALIFIKKYEFNRSVLKRIWMCRTQHELYIMLSTYDVDLMRNVLLLYTYDILNTSQYSLDTSRTASLVTGASTHRTGAPPRQLYVSRWTLHESSSMSSSTSGILLVRLYIIVCYTHGVV